VFSASATTTFELPRWMLETIVVGDLPVLAGITVAAGDGQGPWSRPGLICKHRDSYISGSDGTANRITLVDTWDVADEKWSTISRMKRPKSAGKRLL
jgi:hypothetical protein